MDPTPLDRRAVTGEEFLIVHGSAQARVTQVGATLRSYTVSGQDVIDGVGPGQRARDGRGQILAPWPNRLTDGRYRYGGHECQAPLNEPSRHDAIHGLVRWLDWAPTAVGPSLVTLSCAVRPQPGYEWPLVLDVTYALDESGLSVTMRAGNAGNERAPFGVGFHPYLTLGATSIDGLDLCVPATTPGDFSEPRPIGTSELDTAFTRLARHADGRAVASLSNPQDGRSVELWVDEQFRYLMVYTADHVGEPQRRRTSVAIEPMTCPPDAFRSGVDLVELEAGAAWHGSWGLRPGSSSRG